MLVFEYLLRVFKYLTTAYNNHPVKNTVHMLGLHDFAEKIEGACLKSFDSLQYVTENLNE